MQTVADLLLLVGGDTPLSLPCMRRWLNQSIYFRLGADAETVAHGRGAHEPDLEHAILVSARR